MTNPVHACVARVRRPHASPARVARVCRPRALVHTAGRRAPPAAPVHRPSGCPRAAAHTLSARLIRPLKP
jgi:hypothetical protein